MTAHAEERHRRRETRRALTVVAGALLLLEGCTSSSIARNTNRETVERWLTCEECLNGELDSVRALGPTIAPILSEAVTGPPDSVYANMRASAGRAFQRIRGEYGRLAQAAQLLQPLPDSTIYVTNVADNFQYTFRARAARALDLIDPGAARTLFRRTLLTDSTAGSARPLGAAMRRLLDSLVRTPPP